MSFNVNFLITSETIEGQHQYTECSGDCRANDIFRSENSILHPMRVRPVSCKFDAGNVLLREFLGQAWMKEDKKERAAHICLITERFNDVS